MATTWTSHDVGSRRVFVGCKQESGHPTRYSWYIVDSATCKGWRYSTHLSALLAAEAAVHRVYGSYLCNWCAQRFEEPVADVVGTTITGPDAERCPHCGSNNIQETA